MQSGLFNEFKNGKSDGKKYDVKPADLGDNFTTKDLDSSAKDVRTKLHFVNSGSYEREERSVVSVTGLRKPYPQIHKFEEGLQERCLVLVTGRRELLRQWLRLAALP